MLFFVPLARRRRRPTPSFQSAFSSERAGIMSGTPPSSDTTRLCEEGIRGSETQKRHRRRRRRRASFSSSPIVVFCRRSISRHTHTHAFASVCVFDDAFYKMRLVVCILFPKTTTITLRRAKRRRRRRSRRVETSWWWSSSSSWSSS